MIMNLIFWLGCILTGLTVTFCLFGLVEFLVEFFHERKRHERFFVQQKVIFKDEQGKTIGTVRSRVEEIQEKRKILARAPYN